MYIRSTVLVLIAFSGASVLLMHIPRAWAAGADSYTKLLLHADGGNGTTVLQDFAYTPHVMTANGNAAISTAQKKFGTGSMVFDGDGDFYSAVDSADFEMGAGDFTMDLWVYPTSVTGNAGIVGKGDSSAYGSFLIYRGAGTYYFFATSATGSWTICAISMGTATINTWTHLAIVRNGSTFTSYNNGVAQTTCSSSGTLLDDATALFIGKQYTGGVYFAGYLDEVRISKGIARWTANFTPPTQAYAGGITLSNEATITGNASVLGTLAKGAGTFVIDHPLDPKNKLLYHSFVESPNMMNIYDGIATLDENGNATIELPSYFLALNRDFRYLGTPIGEPMPNLFVKTEVRRRYFIWGDTILKISGGAPNGRISWQVTGTRHDPFARLRPIRVEVPKGPDEIVDVGEFVCPECYAK